METKHTPAPWNFGQKHADQTSNTFSVYDEKGNLIHAGLSPRNYDHITKETSEANAKLIAYAPEMLEVLQQIIKEYDLCIVNGIDAKKIREIITKAT